MSASTRYVPKTKIQVSEVCRLWSVVLGLVQLDRVRLWNQSLTPPRESYKRDRHWNICHRWVFLFMSKVSNLFCLGTAILLKPGIIFGGTLQHDCPTSRAIGYFLEPVITLAPFAKKPMNITVKGITTDEHDLSVCFHNTCWTKHPYLCILKADILRTVTLPHLQLFGISEGLELRVWKFLSPFPPRLT